MNDFTFYSPTRFVFGRGVCARVGAELAAAGYRRALLVYGGGSVVRCGTLDRVKASLDASGIGHAELGGVRPNPELASVRAGIALAREHGVDLILAVGGGSTMDAAKAIAVGAVRDVEGVSGMVTAMGGSVTDLVHNKKNAQKGAKGVKIDMTGAALVLDIYLTVEYGHPIPTVAENAQKAVIGAVEAMTGCSVEAVNIHVGGVTLA